jgi:hypothetical protein
MRLRLGILGLLLPVGLLLAGCVNHHHHSGHKASAPPAAIRKKGPPPHAPAHGYRHKHHAHGVELRFDTGLGVYVVVGHDGHYFHADRFYRVSKGVWYSSAEFKLGWVTISTRDLPPGLAKKKHGNKHGKKRGHGKHSR